MSGQWKEVVRLQFKGPRFRDHALDLCALSELNQFQRIVAETAKALWRAANPDRKNLPTHFEQRTRLCLRKIEEGSTFVPLEVYVDKWVQEELCEREPTEINEAVQLVHSAFVAMERDALLPEGFPKALVPEYAKLGQTLTEGEVMEFIPPGKPAARVTHKHTKRLAAFDEPPHETTVDLTGEVLEADVRRKRCELWIDDKKGIPVMFSEDQEAEITKALKDHRSVRMRVRGRADMSSEGRVLRVKQIEELQVHPTGEVPYDHSARPICDILRELAAEVPQAEWDNLPDDLTDNLDHYIYGTPKK